MKWFCKIALSFLYALLLTGCISVTGRQSPEWYPLPHAVFSDSVYLVQTGSGSSIVAARTEAADRLAAYLKTEVSSQISHDYRSEQRSSDGTVKEQNTEENIRNIALKTDITLTALEYTDPWYNRKGKAWYCCAYIKRAEAFKQIRPEIETEKKTFYGYYNKAESESDPFIKIRYLYAADKAADSFKAELAYGALFSESSVSASYGGDRTVMAEIPAIIKNIQIKNPLYVSVDHDSDNAVYSAVTDVFTGLGYTVSAYKTEAAYTVNVSVHFNDIPEKEVEDDTVLHVLNPDVTLLIGDSTKTVYIFSTKAERTLSYSKVKAESKACRGIAEAVKNILPDNFLTFLYGSK
jgi:hypothetical protein